MVYQDQVRIGILGEDFRNHFEVIFMVSIGFGNDSTRTVPMLPRASGTQGSSEELHSTPPVYPSWDGNYG